MFPAFLALHFKNWIITDAATEKEQCLEVPLETASLDEYIGRGWMKWVITEPRLKKRRAKLEKKSEDKGNLSNNPREEAF